MNYLIRLWLGHRLKFFRMVFFIFCYIIAFKGTVRAQAGFNPAGGYWNSSNQKDAIWELKLVEPYFYFPDNWSNVNHKMTVSSKRPAKYCFYVKTVHQKTALFHCEFLNSITTYKLRLTKAGELPIEGDRVKEYIEVKSEPLGDAVEEYGSFPVKRYMSNPVALEFTEKYYQDHINEWSLEIRIERYEYDGTRITSYPLILKPLHLNIVQNRIDATGCKNTLKLKLETPGNTGTTIKYLSYVGAAAPFIDVFRPTSKVIPADKEEALFDIDVYRIYANESKQLEVIAYQPGYLPARAQIDIEPAGGLAVTAGVYNKTKNNIPVTVSIPECHKRYLVSTPVMLTYSGKGANLLNNPSRTVNIPPRAVSHTFNLLLKPGDKCAENIRISASSTDFGNTTQPVDITIPELRTLQLSATHHPKKGNLNERIAVDLGMISCENNAATVYLEYQGEGKNELIELPTSINLSGDKRTFNLYLNKRSDRCQAKNITITAKATGFEDAKPSIVNLPVKEKKRLEFSVKN